VPLRHQSAGSDRIHESKTRRKTVSVRKLGKELRRLEAMATQRAFARYEDEMTSGSGDPRNFSDAVVHLS
jgi:hypothetical protein